MIVHYRKESVMPTLKESVMPSLTDGGIVYDLAVCRLYELRGRFHRSHDKMADTLLIYFLEFLRGRCESRVHERLGTFPHQELRDLELYLLEEAARLGMGVTPDDVCEVVKEMHSVAMTANWAPKRGYLVQ